MLVDLNMDVPFQKYYHCWVIWFHYYNIKATALNLEWFVYTNCHPFYGKVIPKFICCSFNQNIPNAPTKNKFNCCCLRAKFCFKYWPQVWIELFSFCRLCHLRFLSMLRWIRRYFADNWINIYVFGQTLNFH